MQDIENLRQEKAQLNQEKIEELLEYKNQADMYENERRKSQEVNTQLKSSNQVHSYKNTACAPHEKPIN